MLPRRPSALTTRRPPRPAGRATRPSYPRRQRRAGPCHGGRAAQKRQGEEEELAEPEEKLAPGWAADALRPLLAPSVLSDLMEGEDWPRMAGQMVLLQKAGVDLNTFLPQLGQVTKTVYQAVEANQARIQAEGNDRWADLLKATMPEGLVRDAILSSPAWPDMAAKMALLDQRGVDVAGFLTAAHGQGVSVDRAVAALLAKQGAAAPAAADAATAPGCPPPGPPPPRPRRPPHRPPPRRRPPPLLLPLLRLLLLLRSRWR
ncbi:hypothetical protein ACFXD5_38595 [Streptomyces sp. NPDC059385]|uniref:hypothetical protein n=1 Tax=Streptomyces sp. NPDC059385 TaxID=3346817 RepID=UPI00368E352C